MTIIHGTSASETLTGTSGDDEIYGYDGDDTLNGGAGNDLLDGGTGADTMSGGAGADTYIVDDAGDVVIETSGLGIDTVKISISTYALTANVENLDMSAASGPITVTGNSLANTFYMADGAAVTVNGGSGNDTVNYSSSSLYVVVDLASQTTDGDAVDDTLTSIENVTGTAFDDDLRGTAGANVLDGGAGADILEGRGGNDTYFVDDAGDSVIEQAAEGTDEVRTTIDYTLGDNVEKLRYLGTANFVGVGNALNNDMYGGAFDDYLDGGDGHDYLSGNAGVDSLYGGAGVDVLAGGAGDDYLDGGADGDGYLVDSEFDMVVEAVGGGLDSVQVSSRAGEVSAAFTLPAEVEDLTYTGSIPFTGTGNELNNRMYGHSGVDTLIGMDGDDELRGSGGNDLLYGGDGDDILVGASGTDVLEGGAGSDIFRISGYESGVGSSADTIADFESGFDSIDVSGWDANIWTMGDQAFTFIGTSAFSTVAGQLRYAASGSNTVIEGDVNGDGAADFQILLLGTFTLTSADFVL